MKTFNTTGICVPEKHYMVNLDDRVCAIRKMVDDGKYFVINRARQYGKSTTLNALCDSLIENYVVLSIDFQGIGQSGFSKEEKFVKEICRLIRREAVSGLEIPDDILDKIKNIVNRKTYQANLGELFDIFFEWLSGEERGIVLIIDEVDSATNNQVFLDFLSQLRDGYISRDSKNAPAFKSVILAGVTDIKHVRSRIRDDEQHKVNSPWNIAADFDLDMSLSVDGIKNMLLEYENDYHTGMDVSKMAIQIREYTGGYPLLVSRLCQIMDEKLPVNGNKKEAWSGNGFQEAVKCLVSTKNPLFDSLTGKLTNYPELREAIRSILMDGEVLAYNPLQESITQLEMYGFIRNAHNTVAVSNRIFETVLYNLFLSDKELEANGFSRKGAEEKSLFIKDGKLDMPLVIKKFVETYENIYGGMKESFLEEDGRKLFLLYLKPIINGTGNFYIEAETRDKKRMDVVVNYLGKEFVIEMKIWHGQSKYEDARKQISEYLDSMRLNEGYLLTFNFNKSKKASFERVEYSDKVLYEGIV